MLRKSLVLSFAIALLGCSDSSPTEGYGEPALEEITPVTYFSRGLFAQQASPAVDGAAGTAGLPPGESYIYEHALTISMASTNIKARFDRARQRCEADTTLKCKVMSASFRILGTPAAPLPYAQLTVAMPHNGIAPFETGLLEPLPREDAHEVVVQSRSTSAQNVTQQVADVDRRLAQLADYRDRLAALSKRPNTSTDELIKIEGEISKTQSELEQVATQRRDLAERIAKENLHITFLAESTVGDALQPVRNVWQSSLRLLGESTAAALGFFILALPWIPLVVLAVLLLRWLWRRVRRKAA